MHGRAARLSSNESLLRPAKRLFNVLALMSGFHLIVASQLR
jgi:hypothetical protein